MAEFKPIEYPCEGCGEAVVVLAAGDTALPANNWSEELLAFWCPSCWTAHADRSRDDG